MATALNVRWASWAVHGFLHINGYDHYTPEEEAEMFGLQEEILDSLWTHKTINENGRIATCFQV